MKSFKKILLLLLSIVLIFVVYLVYNALNFKKTQLNVDPIEVLEINFSSTENFSEAIKIKTISPQNISDFDSIYFQNFTNFLKETYPLVDSLLEKMVFNSFSHLYIWKGSDLSLKPILLLAHLDVVPVIEEDITLWKQDPFGGEIVNNMIWGRGTIDNKNGVVGIMEALGLLLKDGFLPKRSIYIAFGHDEEIGGLNGARKIAEYLKEEHIEAEFILDEGGSIVQKLIPDIEKDVALIGIAEKGFVSLEISASIAGGHSSMPERETAIDVLANAIVKLNQNPFPAVISPAIDEFIGNLGPEMPFKNKLIFANKSIFKSIITGIYEASASGNALVRTTTSPTIFNSGVKDNIIPLSASAVINFRIIPGETIATVTNRVKQIINDDRITFKQGAFASEPSHVSSTSSFGYRTLNKTILEIYPNTLVTPYLVLGATDSRHFSSVSDNIYRFSAMKINKENIKSFHGLNERISVSDFENSIRFYHQLIINSTSK